MNRHQMATPFRVTTCNKTTHSPQPQRIACTCRFADRPASQPFQPNRHDSLGSFTVLAHFLLRHLTRPFIFPTMISLFLPRVSTSAARNRLIRLTALMGEAHRRKRARTWRQKIILSTAMSGLASLARPPDRRPTTPSHSGHTVTDIQCARSSSPPWLQSRHSPRGPPKPTSTFTHARRLFLRRCLSRRSSQHLCLSHLTPATGC